MSDKPKEKTERQREDEGRKEAKGIIQSLFGPFAAMLPDSNVVISLLDPWLIDETSESAAKKAMELFPKYPWLKGKAARSAISAFSAKLEDEDEKHTGVTKLALKKASDWLKAFEAALGQEESTSTTAKPEATAKPPRPSQDFHEHDKRVLESARVRLEQAWPEEEKDLGKRLVREAKTNARVKAILTEGLPPRKTAVKPEPPKESEESEPWTTKFSADCKKFAKWVSSHLKSGDAKLNAELEPINARLAAGNEARRKRNQDWKPTESQVELGDSLANPFWVVFKLIFGFTPNLRWVKKLWRWLDKREEDPTKPTNPANKETESHAAGAIDI